LGTFSGSDETNWTQVAYNYTANKTEPQLIFGMEGDAQLYILIDDVSIVDNANTLVEVLANPSFDNSSATPPIGWSVWCSNTCAGSSEGSVVTSDCRVASNCYKSQCHGTNARDYLVQTFPAIVNQTYTISFWYRRERSYGLSGIATLYVGII
jgi:hypothetical protein